MAFPAVLARAHPRLRGWVLRRGLLPTDLTELFSAEELDSGSALTELQDELEVDSDEVGVFEHDFWELLTACGQESRRQHARLASVPIWQMHLEAEAKRRRRWKDDELDRFDADEARMGRQVLPPPPANPRFATARRRSLALDGDVRAREKAEEAERNKWLGRLQVILDSLDLETAIGLRGRSAPDQGARGGSARIDSASSGAHLGAIPQVASGGART